MNFVNILMKLIKKKKKKKNLKEISRKFITNFRRHRGKIIAGSSE